MKNQINCIVLIDDDHPINQYHETLINQTGIVSFVKLANSTEDGLRYFTHCKKENNPKPNIVLLDIHMPGLNGWAFIEAFNHLNTELKKNVAIYMVTTSENPDDLERARLEPAVNGIMPKPLNPVALNKILKAYLEEN